MNVLDRIFISDTTLIGYDTRNEISVKKLLRFIPSVTLFESTDASKIIQQFKSLSNFRDCKLNSLLNDNLTNFIVVDLSTVSFKEDDFSKAKDFVRELQNLLFNTESLVKFKLILLTGIYVTMTPMNIQRYEVSLNYVADLVIKFLGDTVLIEKDGITGNRYINNTKQELRNLSFKSLLDEIAEAT